MTEVSGTNRGRLGCLTNNLMRSFSSAAWQIRPPPFRFKVRQYKVSLTCDVTRSRRCGVRVWTHVCGSRNIRSQPGRRELPIRWADTQHLQLCVCHFSLRLSASVDSFTDKCVDGLLFFRAGLEPNRNHTLSISSKTPGSFVDFDFMRVLRLSDGAPYVLRWLDREMTNSSAGSPAASNLPTQLPANPKTRAVRSFLQK